MFLLPFFKYLKPHRWRLSLGILCMLGVGFFGTYNILMAKPALDVLFGEVNIEERQRDYENDLVDHREDEQEYLKSDRLSVRLKGEFYQAFYNPAREKIDRVVLALYRYASENETKCLRLIASIFVGLTILAGFMQYGFRYNMAYALFSAVIEMKSDLFRHVMRQDLRYFTSKPVGYLMSRITSDVSAIRTVLDALIRNAALQVVQVVFLTTLLLVIHPKTTVYVFLGILPAGALLAWFAHTVKKITRKERRKQDELTAVMNESLGNVRLVKAMTTEDIECERFDQQNRKLFDYEMRRRMAKFGSSPIMEVFGAIGAGGVLLFGGYAVLRQEYMDASTFFVYLGALTRFYRPLKILARLNVSWQISKVSAERMLEMLNLTPTITDPPPGVEPVELAAIEKGLSVHDVTFAYESRLVLSEFSAEFPKGKTTAIVGRSGSGKTTLMNLLLRLYDPNEGAVRLDGHDLLNFRVRDLRSHYAVVSQETLLFNATIAENIAYGSDEKPDRDRVIEAAKAAFAHDFIWELDGGRGYDTVVGPGGAKLSGGQRQRIAVARAFYRDPQILLLDEATSALDSESESAVQKALARLMSSRTVIVIAHRLSTVMHADNILVLDAGRLVEQGRHEDLIAQGGHYAMLYRVGEIAEDSEESEAAAPAPVE